VIANLEAPLTLRDRVYPGKASLRADPRWAALLKQAGVVAVSLGNNHIMDSGAQGLEDTCQALDDAGIAYTGAGRDLASARTPVILNAGALRVGLLSYNAVPVKAPIYAAKISPGVVKADRRLIAQDVAALRSGADFVIVALHWGLERYRLPTSEQRELARAVIGCGADAIVGHHPHILQGTEWVAERPVLYSLGNFLFSPLTWTGIGGDGQPFTETLAVDVEGRTGAIATLSLRARTPPSVDCTFSFLDQELIPRDNNVAGSVVAARGRKLGPLYGIHWPLEVVRMRASPLARRLARGARKLKARLLRK
jgi:poly-gamma-glutamate capsule biosynthesis protein CapA/YwtB (metallophosphatase superfamily)